MAISATKSFAPSDESAGQARSWCQERVATSVDPDTCRADLVDDLALVVSELVTNAVNAGSSKTVLTLLIAPASVTVAVTDDVETLPLPRRPGPDETSGRGLAVVAALSSDWGVTPWGVGKTVWAELPIA
jgi:anti-sigma regulatory factor (Ser/Thr protein kinase)